MSPVNKEVLSEIIDQIEDAAMSLFDEDMEGETSDETNAIAIAEHHLRKAIEELAKIS